VKTSDFYYGLPKGLIAQTPLSNRADSRLLVLNKTTGGITHDRFYNILDYLKKGDCLVINDTKVIPARLFGVKDKTGAKIEAFLLRRLDDDRWEAALRPGKRVKDGDRIIFAEKFSAAQEADPGGGARVLRFEYIGDFNALLNAYGDMPLPRYITRKLADKDRYQTVYAEHAGSAAAPTAGLHFTAGILAAAAAKGVSTARVTLHVGLGTFRPVKCENIEEHQMHSEYYTVDETQAEIINGAKRNGGRIIAVGTTSCRTLEARAGENGLIAPGAGFTDIFIYPGYTFKVTDALITNFHLPESTLIMLVSALAGRDSVLNAYRRAIDEGYRFYSFGDAMLVV